MPGLTNPRSGGLAVAALATLLLLGALAFLVYRYGGGIAAVALVVTGSVAVVVGVLVLARRELRRANEELSVTAAALGASPQAVFIVDALRAGRPNRYVNRAYAALTGYEAEEAVGNGFDALTIFADPEAVARLAAEGQSGDASPVTLRRRDGAALEATLALRQASGGNGEPRLIGFLEPLADSKRAPERRRPRVDLHDGAAPENAAKDAFLSALSHDLRSPLNACVMWLDVLALAPQADKVQQAVEAIKRNLSRQTKLINDLSDAAKVSSNRLEVELAPLDLVALIRGQVDAWQLLALGKELTFEQDIEPASAPILGDAARLTQALNHLLENSLSSTPSGGRVALRVRTADDVCIVEIDDTGTALSPEDAANLALPLVRAPTSSKTRPGVGLSLAVAHHLAERHGGSLSATSGRAGTRFTLTLPLAAAG